MEHKKLVELANMTDNERSHVEDMLEAVTKFNENRTHPLYVEMRDNARELFESDGSGEPGYRYGIIELILTMTIRDYSADMFNLVGLDIEGKLT